MADFVGQQDVDKMLKYEYKNRRAKETLQRLSSPTGVLVEGAVLRSLREQGFQLDVNLDNKSEYDPIIQFERLAKYYQPKSTVLEVDDDAWDQAYSVTKRAFVEKGIILDPIEDKSSLIATLKLEKASGAPEFSAKGDSVERDYARMLKWVSGNKAAEPCVAFHRIQHGSEGPKQRLVWGYPTMVTLAEATFARPLIDYFLNRVSPMAFGLKRVHLAARMTPIENMGVRYGFDFSGFDSSLHGKLISMAFSILKNFFTLYGDLERRWELVVNYFIHTPILMPDGYVYQKHKGVPSGSYFTQLIDSVVNYFVIQYASIKLTGMAIDDGKVMVLGDDSIFGLPVYITIDKWRQVFAGLGMDLSSKKSDLWADGEDVHFLGHYWHYGLVDRDSREIAVRMAFPERRSGISDARKRIVTRVFSYVTDAVSSHQIIFNWSRYKADIPGVYCREIEGNLTGWNELQDMTLEDEDPLLIDSLQQAYVGILR